MTALPPYLATLFPQGRPEGGNDPPLFPPPRTLLLKQQDSRNIALQSVISEVDARSQSDAFLETLENHDLDSKVYLLQKVLPALLPALNALTRELEKGGNFDANGEYAKCDRNLGEYQPTLLRKMRSLLHADMQRNTTTRENLEPIRWLAERLMRHRKSSSEEAKRYFKPLDEIASRLDLQSKAQEKERKLRLEADAFARQQVRDLQREADLVVLRQLFILWTCWIDQLKTSLPTQETLTQETILNSDLIVFCRGMVDQYPLLCDLVEKLHKKHATLSIDSRLLITLTSHWSTENVEKLQNVTRSFILAENEKLNKSCEESIQASIQGGYLQEAIEVLDLLSSTQKKLSVLASIEYDSKETTKVFRECVQRAVNRLQEAGPMQIVQIAQQGQAATEHVLNASDMKARALLQSHFAVNSDESPIQSLETVMRQSVAQSHTLDPLYRILSIVKQEVMPLLGEYVTKIEGTLQIRTEEEIERRNLLSILFSSLHGTISHREILLRIAQQSYLESRFQENLRKIEISSISTLDEAIEAIVIAARPLNDLSYRNIIKTSLARVCRDTLDRVVERQSFLSDLENLLHRQSQSPNTTMSYMLRTLTSQFHKLIHPYCHSLLIIAKGEQPSLVVSLPKTQLQDSILRTELCLPILTHLTTTQSLSPWSKYLQEGHALSVPILLEDKNCQKGCIVTQCEIGTSFLETDVEFLVQTASVFAKGISEMEEFAKGVQMALSSMPFVAQLGNLDVEYYIAGGFNDSLYYGGEVKRLNVEEEELVKDKADSRPASKSGANVNQTGSKSDADSTITLDSNSTVPLHTQQASISNSRLDLKPTPNTNSSTPIATSIPVLNSNLNLNAESEPDHITESNSISELEAEPILTSRFQDKNAETERQAAEANIQIDYTSEGSRQVDHVVADNNQIVADRSQDVDDCQIAVGGSQEKDQVVANLTQTTQAAVDQATEASAPMYSTIEQETKQAVTEQPENSDSFVGEHSTEEVEQQPNEKVKIEALTVDKLPEEEPEYLRPATAGIVVSEEASRPQTGGSGGSTRSQPTEADEFDVPASELDLPASELDLPQEPSQSNGVSQEITSKSLSQLAEQPEQKLSDLNTISTQSLRSITKSNTLLNSSLKSSTSISKSNASLKSSRKASIIADIEESDEAEDEKLYEDPNHRIVQPDRYEQVEENVDEKLFLFESMQTRSKVITPGGRVAIPILSATGNVLAVISVRAPFSERPTTQERMMGVKGKKSQLHERNEQQHHAAILEIENVVQHVEKGLKLMVRSDKIEEDPILLDAERLGVAAKMDLMVPRLMFVQARVRVQNAMSTKAIAELRSYRVPPVTIHRVLQCVLFLFDYTPRQLFRWIDTVRLINVDLLKQMLVYDPTIIQRRMRFIRINAVLPHIPAGEVRKYGSLPAEAMYHWLVVAHSLRQKALLLRKKSKQLALQASTGNLVPHELQVAQERLQAEVAQQQTEYNQVKQSVLDLPT